MAKSKFAKRKHTAQAEQSQKLQKLAPPLDAASRSEPKSLQTLVSEEELETTIETLNVLAGYLGVLKSRACRELRGAVFGFRQACTTGVNSAREYCCSFL
jgi:hypothetical protein